MTSLIRTIPRNALESLVARLFQTEAVSQSASYQAAKVLVAADCRGISSHGVKKLFTYLQGLRDGSIAAQPFMRTLSETPVSALLDGGNGLGMVVGTWAMNVCLNKARTSGMASIAVCHSNHFGIAGYYAMMALEHDMIGIAMTNAPPRVIPTNGTRAGYGTNPIAIAIPAGNELPFVLDMATSVRSLGQIQLLGLLGEQLPGGWVVDSQGETVLDPDQAVLRGILLPLGGEEATAGYKGYGLGVMVDILCGPLSGALFGQKIATSSAQIAGTPANIGHFFIAWKIDLFRPVREFKAAVDQLVHDIREIQARKGTERVLLAGEKEYEAEQQSEREGVPLHEEVWLELKKLAQERDIGD